MRSSSPSKATCEDHLVKLRNVEVYDVDSIELTYTLGRFTHTIAENAILKPDATKLLIQRSNTSHDESVDLVICTKLAKWLHVDVFLVWICVSQTVEGIETIFKTQGIPELEVVNNSIDHSCSQGVDGRNGFKSHAPRVPPSPSQGPTTTAPDSLYDPHPQKQKNQAVEVVTSSLAPNPRDPPRDFSPRGKTVGVVTGRSPPSAICDPEYDTIPQVTTNPTYGAVSTSQDAIPKIPESQYDLRLQYKTDRTVGAITRDQNPLPIIRDQYDLGPQNKAGQMAEVVTRSQNPTPEARNLQYNLIPGGETEQTIGVVTSSQSSTPTAYDPQYDSSSQGNMDRQDPTSITDHSSEFAAHSEVLIARPSHLSPHDHSLPYNMNPTPSGTSFAYPTGFFNQNASLPANGPEFLSGAPPRTGDYYTGDSPRPASEQQIADGIAGELFVSSAAVALF